VNDSDENVDDSGHASSSDAYDNWVLTGWYGWIFWIIRQFDIRLQVSRPRCVLCKWGWVGPSKHNCCRIIFIG